MRSIAVAACFSAILLSATQAQYVIQDDYEATNFADMFDFYTGADPTNGYVNYVDQGTAQSSGLYSTQNGSMYMGVDSTNVASGSGRNSIRVTSKNVYNHGLIILDLEHMPGGICGTWPAFWMFGQDWPNNGELDILEGVNAASTNTMTLHTGSTCEISNTGSMSGTIATSDCWINDPNQPANAGCSIDNANEAIYGAGFNYASGGVYATEWTSEAINIWYFPRSAIPSDITSGNPDPSGWGLALSTFTGSCDLDSHVDNMQIVFDTTFCGDWAGAVWSSDAICSSLASTCQDYVQNNPSAFADAYWLVNSLKVYQNNGAVAPSSTPAPTASSTLTSISTSTTLSTLTSISTSTTSSTSTSISTSTIISTSTATSTSTTSLSASSFGTSSAFTTSTTYPPPPSSSPPPFSSSSSSSFGTSSAFTTSSASTTSFITSTWSSWSSEYPSALPSQASQWWGDEYSSAWANQASQTWTAGQSWQTVATVAPGIPASTQGWGQGPSSWTGGRPGHNGGNGGW